MQTRAADKEWMDTGNYSPECYQDCLYKLDRIGRLLGGDRATLASLKKLKKTPKTILDIGCGGGIFSIRIAKMFPDSQVIGIDTSADAIAFANHQLHHFYPSIKNVTFNLTASQLNYPSNAFDVVLSTLVLHHLTDLEIPQFLKDSFRIARHAVIINDLHRHPFAYASYFCIAPILFRNRMITHDGLLSIKKGFKKEDWNRYFVESEIPLESISLSRYLGFRWVAMLHKEEEEYSNGL